MRTLKEYEALINSIVEGGPEDPKGKAAAVSLMAEALFNLHRIADSLEGRKPPVFSAHMQDK